MHFSHLSLITVLLPGCFAVENLITRLHERCLRLICSDKISPCEELLDKDNSVLIHQNNLQKLDIEMFKTYTGTASQIKNEVFSRNCVSNYNLRRDPQFASRAVNTVHYGSEPLDFLGSKKNMRNAAFWSEKLWFTKFIQIRNKNLAATRMSLYALQKIYSRRRLYTSIVGVCLTILWDQVVNCQLYF